MLVYHPFHLIYQYQIVKKNKEGMDRNNVYYTCIMANARAIQQHVAEATDQLSSPSGSTIAE